MRRSRLRTCIAVAVSSAARARKVAATSATAARNTASPGGLNSTLRGRTAVSEMVSRSSSVVSCQAATASSTRLSTTRPAVTHPSSAACRRRLGWHSESLARPDRPSPPILSRLRPGHPLRRDLERGCGRAVAGQRRVGGSGDEPAEEGCQDEQPQLPDGVPAREQGRADGAGGVRRRVRHRDADEADQGQREPDGDRCEALGGAGVGDAEDDVQEERSEQDLGDRHGPPACSGWPPGRRRWRSTPTGSADRGGCRVVRRVQRVHARRVRGSGRRPPAALPPRDRRGLHRAGRHRPGPSPRTRRPGRRLVAAAAAYEAAIADAGGIDLQIVGIGTDGHIGFNEPRSSLASRTRMKTLTQQTRLDNRRFFDGDLDAVPTHCLTQGLGTIMAARHVVLVGAGAAKAAACESSSKVRSVPVGRRRCCSTTSTSACWSTRQRPTAWSWGTTTATPTAASRRGRGSERPAARNRTRTVKDRDVASFDKVTVTGV